MEREASFGSPLFLSMDFFEHLLAAVLENHALEGGFWAEMQQHADFDARCAKHVQQLPGVRVVECSPGLCLDDHFFVGQEVGAVMADPLSMVHDVNGSFANENQFVAFQLDLKSAAVHALEKTVAQFVVDPVERVDDAAGRRGREQGCWHAVTISRGSTVWRTETMRGRSEERNSSNGMDADETDTARARHGGERGYAFRAQTPNEP